MPEVNKLFTILQKGSKYQVILFPYAGGTINSFKQIQRYLKLLPSETQVIQLNYPGHDVNQDSLIQNVKEFENYFDDMLKGLLKIPTWFLGYSLGGQLAFRFFLKYKRNFENLKGLFICATPAPSYIRISSNLQRENWDNTILSPIINNQDYFQSSHEIYQIQEEWLSYFSPIFESDIKLFQDCKISNCTLQNKLPTVNILYGNKDSSVTVDGLIAWCNYFYITNFYSLEGGHLFIDEEGNAQRVIKIIGETMNNLY